MSRIGVVPVPVPKGVEVKIAGRQISAKGPQGALELQTTGNIDLTLADELVTVSRGDDAKHTKSLHGLYRKLISNMVVGVSTGFQKVLLVNGVGYRAEVQGKNLVLNLGYSNPVNYPIPADIKIEVDGGNRIIVAGCDRQSVGQTAAEIRGYRPPEPYKGKGIRYEDERVRRKAGKATVATA